MPNLELAQSSIVRFTGWTYADPIIVTLIGIWVHELNIEPFLRHEPHQH